nr:MAG TPA: hypothetical protein [Bacteriophage sp.]
MVFRQIAQRFYDVRQIKADKLGFVRKIVQMRT